MIRSHSLTVAAAAALVWLGAQTGYADGWSIFGRHQERGSGQIATETRTVGDFDRIDLSCSANLRVSFGDSCRVTVTIDDNLQDNIVTEVTGNRTLMIDSDGSYTSHHDALIEITMPTLAYLEVDGSGDVEMDRLKSESLEIELNGSGDVDFDGSVKDLRISARGSGQVTALDLNAEDVKIEIRGSGDVKLRGKATVVDCAVYGSGDIDAGRLLAEQVGARIHGSGDISVYAEESFEGGVYGSGDIDLYGNPADVDRQVAGSGSIRRR